MMMGSNRLAVCTRLVVPRTAYTSRGSLGTVGLLQCVFGIVVQQPGRRQIVVELKLDERLPRLGRTHRYPMRTRAMATTMRIAGMTFTVGIVCVGIFAVGLGAFATMFAGVLAVIVLVCFAAAFCGERSGVVAEVAEAHLHPFLGR